MVDIINPPDMTNPTFGNIVDSLNIIRGFSKIEILKIWYLKFRNLKYENMKISNLKNLKSKIEILKIKNRNFENLKPEILKIKNLKIWDLKFLKSEIRKSKIWKYDIKIFWDFLDYLMLHNFKIFYHTKIKK